MRVSASIARCRRGRAGTPRPRPRRPAGARPRGPRGRRADSRWRSSCGACPRRPRARALQPRAGVHDAVDQDEVDGGVAEDPVPGEGGIAAEDHGRGEHPEHASAGPAAQRSSCPPRRRAAPATRPTSAATTTSGVASEAVASVAAHARASTTMTARPSGSRSAPGTPAGGEPVDEQAAAERQHREQRGQEEPGLDHRRRLVGGVDRGCEIRNEEKKIWMPDDQQRGREQRRDAPRRGRRIRGRSRCRR